MEVGSWYFIQYFSICKILKEEKVKVDRESNKTALICVHSSK